MTEPGAPQQVVPGASSAAMPVGGRQRLTLRPEAALLETVLAGGEGMPVRTLPYHSIRALYVYDEPDWPYLAILLGYWLAIAVASLLLVLLPQVSLWMALGVLGVATVALAVYGVLRLKRRQRRMLRIEQPLASLVVEARSPEFLAAFAAHVEQAAAEASAPDPAPPPPAPEATPAPGPPEGWQSYYPATGPEVQGQEPAGSPPEEQPTRPPEAPPPA